MVPFFRLAEKEDFGPFGTKIPLYPSAVFLKFIVEWANEHGYMPSKVYEQYLRNPKDFTLLSAYRKYKAEREKEEIDKEKSKAKK